MREQSARYLVDSAVDVEDPLFVGPSALCLERRANPRARFSLSVNYRHGEIYLFSRTSDLSELGIFVVAERPLPVATRLHLVFRMPDGKDRIAVEGEVVWIDRVNSDHEQGMGIRFLAPSPRVRQELSALVRTIMYLE